MAKDAFDDFVSDVVTEAKRPKPSAPAPPPGSSGVPVTDSGSPVIRHAMPYRLTPPVVPLSAVFLSITAGVIFVGAFLAAIMSLGEPARAFGLFLEGCSAAAVVGGFAAVIRSTSAAAHFSQQTAELLQRADARAWR